MQRIAIYGAGGFGREVMMLVEQINAHRQTFDIVGFFDDKVSRGSVLNNYPGWLANMIQENDLGLVVPPDAPEAFADGLIRLMDDAALRERCGRNARLFSEKHFARQRLGDEFVTFLETLA